VADAVPDVDDPSVRVRDVHLLQGGAEKCLQDASASGISAVASKRMAADHRGPSLGYDGRIASNNSRMPWGTAGAGQTLAIMEIGGGFGQGALDTYFFGLGISKSTTTTVGVDNAVNTPGNDPGR